MGSYQESKLKDGLPLPRPHLVAITMVACATALLFFFLPASDVIANRSSAAASNPIGSSIPIAPSSVVVKEGDIVNQREPAPIPETNSTQFTQYDNKANETTTPAEKSVSVANTPSWRNAQVENGDNLTSIFKRLGLNARDVYAVSNAKSHSKALAKLRPGDEIAICLDAEGVLENVKYTRSSLEYYLYERKASGFEGKKMELKPELRTRHVAGIIDSSLFLDGRTSGLNDTKIMELAGIFGWDVDFALDIRKGDSFSVLYEEKFLGEEHVGTGDILAASFTNRGNSFHAVRFIETDGTRNYYSPSGQPMRKAFLRAPLDFTRISSNFNLRRLHPIHKKIRAHRGVDYAAPRGTPVYAAGKGKVIASAYNKANGNYVFIQHGETYVTKYLHLHKRYVRKGEHVQQKQRIGSVGSTGYSTAPHLHYEFLVNGVHKNPRTVKLPAAKPIASAHRAEFLAQTTPLISDLSRRDSIKLAAITEKTTTAARPKTL